jgi:hypothetical protein
MLMNEHTVHVRAYVWFLYERMAKCYQRISYIQRKNIYSQILWRKGRVQRGNLQVQAAKAEQL